jgi:hypothetical protein
VFVATRMSAVTQTAQQIIAQFYALHRERTTI